MAEPVPTPASAAPLLQSLKRLVDAVLAWWRNIRTRRPWWLPTDPAVTS